MELDDQELCLVEELEPISIDAVKRQQGKLPPAEDFLSPLWKRLAMHLVERFDGIMVANTALQESYGGAVIPHERHPQQLRLITAIKSSIARRRYGLPDDAKVVLFFLVPRRHNGLLDVAAAAELPENLQPLFVVAGAIPYAELERHLVGRLQALCQAETGIIWEVVGGDERCITGEPCRVCPTPRR